MRTRSILLAAGVLTMSLTPIISGQASASEKIYDWTTIAGTVTNSGSADGTNSAARFNFPYGVAVDTNGNVYVADTSNNTIRKVTPVGTNLSVMADWVTTTIAGSAGSSGTADGTNGAAQFCEPSGVAVDTNSNVYVADTYNHTIRKITPVVGTTNWVTTTIAGAAGVSGAADGTNSAALFFQPWAVALDANGNIYVADMNNFTIRKITPVGTNWVTTTIAGSAGDPGSDDGTNSAALFSSPDGIAVDTNGNVYVADMNNFTIRKITPVVGTTNWVTTTIAGSAGYPGFADGTSSAAQFHYPFGVAVDANGNLHVADYGNHTIRKVIPVGTNWVTTTIGGLAENHGSADGFNDRARFYEPAGVAVDGSGNVYVADYANRTIRLGVPWGALTITKEIAKVNFAKTNSDSCTLTATLDLGAGYDLTNKLVSLDIGGADVTFNLDAKGKGRGVGDYGTCKLSYKKKTALWTFTAALKNGSWASQWETYGLSNATTIVKDGVPVTLPVTLIIGDEGFAGEKALLYKAKATKSGSAKGARRGTAFGLSLRLTRTESISQTTHSLKGT